MKEKDVAALRPVEQTRVEICAALGRIADAKASAGEAAASIGAEKAEKTADFSLDSTHRRKLNDRLEDLQMDIAQLDALDAQVRAPLAEVEKAEREAAWDAERLEIREEMKRLDEQWAEQYPPLHHAIAELLEPRRDLARRIEEHNSATGNYLKSVDLAAFQLPSAEVRLMRTDEERAEASVPWHLQQSRAMAAADEARRQSRTALRPAAASFDPPRPTLTVGGVPQDFTGAGWR